MMSEDSGVSPSSARATDLRFHDAVVLRQQGNLLQADALCAAILHANPRQFEAYHLRGLIALEKRDIHRGIDFIGRSLAINPDQPLAYSNVGNALLDIGQPQLALQSLDQALRLNPDLLVAHYNRGNVLKALGRLEDALASYDQVLSVDNAHAKAMNNRGLILEQLGRTEEALDVFAAAASGVDFIAPIRNLSVLLLKLGRSLEALTACDRWLAAAPRDIDGLRVRATALLQLARRDEAADTFSELLRLQPDDSAALENLWHLRLERCDWGGHDSLTKRVFDSLRRTQRFISPLTLILSDDAALSLECARAFTAAHHPPNDSLGPCPVRTPNGGRRIRVAYVSADFHDHPVSQLLVGVLEQHDRSRFEVIGVTLRPRRGGNLEHRVHAAFDRCIDASDLSDRDVAKQMRERDIDIAVDLMGFTEGSRQGIFAHRAAAVQAGYLGYAGTLGASYIDYLVADAMVVPPGYDACYSERIIRLPHCYLPTDDRRLIAAAPTRVEAGLPADAFVYCAFTKAQKIDPTLFAVWMCLLRETPHSILWLRDMGPAARENLMREATAAGVDHHRLLFAPRVASAAEHLARCTLADLYLDTRPYGAHSTACEILWAGVPVLTCTGNSFASRVAASALAAADLPELVTHRLEDYGQRALELAQQPQRLRALRARLGHGRRAALFDTQRQVRALESAYLQMHAG